MIVDDDTLKRPTRGVSAAVDWYIGPLSEEPTPPFATMSNKWQIILTATVKGIYNIDPIWVNNQLYAQALIILVWEVCTYVQMHTQSCIV